jgi:thiamine transport system ATP-binding protein
MIEIAGLIARAGDYTVTADLTVPAGAVCAVIGPSGGGKTTLLNAIAGFAPIEAGTIRIAGRDVTGLHPADRPVTLLFQSDNLFPHLTLAQNTGLGLRPSLSLTREERARVETALADVGLAGLGPRLPGQLSGGQQSRAALARALLRDRPALLLDEPFSALGPAQRAEMLALTRTRAVPRGIAVLMVTHDPDEARTCDFVAFCAEGRVGGARPAAQAFAAPSPDLAAYLGGPA